MRPEDVVVTHIYPLRPGLDIRCKKRDCITEKPVGRTVPLIKFLSSPGSLYVSGTTTGELW